MERRSRKLSNGRTPNANHHSKRASANDSSWNEPDVFKMTAFFDCGSSGTKALMVSEEEGIECPTTETYLDPSWYKAVDKIHKSKSTGDDLWSAAILNTSTTESWHDKGKLLGLKYGFVNILDEKKRPDGNDETKAINLFRYELHRWCKWVRASIAGTARYPEDKDHPPAPCTEIVAGATAGCRIVPKRNGKGDECQKIWSNFQENDSAGHPAIKGGTISGTEEALLEFLMFVHQKSNRFKENLAEAEIPSMISMGGASSQSFVTFKKGTGRKEALMDAFMNEWAEVCTEFESVPPYVGVKSRGINTCILENIPAATNGKFKNFKIVDGDKTDYCVRDDKDSQVLWNYVQKLTYTYNREEYVGYAVSFLAFPDRAESGIHIYGGSDEMMDAFIKLKPALGVKDDNDMALPDFYASKTIDGSAEPYKKVFWGSLVDKNEFKGWLNNDKAFKKYLTAVTSADIKLTANSKSNNMYFKNAQSNWDASKTKGTDKGRSWSAAWNLAITEILGGPDKVAFTDETAADGSKFDNDYGLMMVSVYNKKQYFKCEGDGPSKH